MAQSSAVLVAPRPVSATLVGTAAAGLTVIALAILIAWPLLAVLARGALTPAPYIVATLGVTLASTAAALAMAAGLVAAVRRAIPAAHGVAALCRAGLLLPPFVVPLAVLALADGGLLPLRPGALLVVAAQALAFLPHAFALVMRALAAVSPSAEQAAELLGASRGTVLRRVTLPLARPGLISAAGIVLGLCLADVATPLLLGGKDVFVLSALVVDAPAAAVMLGGLTALVALAGRTWREAGAVVALSGPAGLVPRSWERALLAAFAWLVAAALLALWVTVPVVSVPHWAALGGPLARPLLDSVALGLATGLTGMALALAVAWLIERRGGALATVGVTLVRLPVVAAGVVGGAGYLAAFGARAGSLVPLALLVAAWQLPRTSREAAEVLAGSDRTREHAAFSLGAGRLTTWRRILLPALSPAVLSIVAGGFAAGVGAVGTVAVVAARGGVPLAVTHMLASASAGRAGAACAVATVLLALAGGATLLGRAAAGRESIPTLLA